MVSNVEPSTMLGATLSVSKGRGRPAAPDGGPSCESGFGRTDGRAGADVVRVLTAINASIAAHGAPTRIDRPAAVAGA